MSDKLREIAAQFRRPEGGRGVEMARVMDACNGAMNRAATGSLGLSGGESVLELGHGVCGHLELLPAGVRYCGLEISESMAKEAARLNRDAVEAGRASFLTYDGRTLPFADASFDKAFTVNTIYFWGDPGMFLGEVCRVLRPGGLFAVTFSYAEYMSTLPFTGYGFRLYDPGEAERMVAASGAPFTLVRTDEAADVVRDPADRPIERRFATLVLRK